MKRKIKNLVGAALCLLAAFTQDAAAQTTSILFNAPVSVQTSVKPPRYISYHQVLSMHEDGTGLQQLTTARTSSWFPSRSPDQRYVAFVRDGFLHVMETIGEANGARLFVVAPASASGSDWSPDGSMIVFCGNTANGNGLWIVSVNPDTQAVGTPALVRGGVCLAPSWSPDGTRIAFHLNGIVRVLDLITSAEISFPSSSISPAWSPDGTKIAFGGVVCYRTTKGNQTTTNCYYEIVMANPDGSQWTPITRLQSDCDYPTWSPDGAKIAFRRTIDGSYSVYKTTLGSGITTLFYEGALLPNWAP